MKRALGFLGSQEGARSAVEVLADAQSLRRQWYKPMVVVSMRYVCPATTMTGVTLPLLSLVIACSSQSLTCFTTIWRAFTHIEGGRQDRSPIM